MSQRFGKDVERNSAGEEKYPDRVPVFWLDGDQGVSRMLGEQYERVGKDGKKEVVIRYEIANAEDAGQPKIKLVWVPESQLIETK